MSPHPCTEHRGHSMAFDMWRDYLGLNASIQAILQSRPVPGGASCQEDAPDPCQERAKTAAHERQRERRCQLPPEPPAPKICDPDTLRRDSDFTQCSFCKHNGEAPSFYTAHSLKDYSGKVVCPILSVYRCPQCGASGDRAHTRRFCPLTKESYTSVYHTAARNSDGKKSK